MKIETFEQQLAMVEAILFLSKDPVEPQRIMDFLEITDIGELEKLLEAMTRLHGDARRGVALKRAGGGLQLVSKSELHDSLKDFFTIRQTTKLSIAALEVLSIVAYKQPTTLPEISHLRGVNSSVALKSLLQKKLVRITGRKKVPGLPALYSTTPEFLIYFGLNDLSELPSLEELTELFEDKEQPSLFNRR